MYIYIYILVSAFIRTSIHIQQVVCMMLKLCAINLQYSISVVLIIEINHSF